MTTELGPTPEQLETLAFRLRSRPKWLREETIREWLVETFLTTEEFKQKLTALWAEIEPDPRLVATISQTFDEFRELRRAKAQ